MDKEKWDAMDLAVAEYFDRCRSGRFAQKDFYELLYALGEEAKQFPPYIGKLIANVLVLREATGIAEDYFRVHPEKENALKKEEAARRCGDEVLAFFENLEK